MSRIWTQEEVDLLINLRPYCSLEEISQCLLIQGYMRSIEGIERKARKLRLSYDGLPNGLPPSYLFKNKSYILDTILSLRGQQETVITPSRVLSSSKKSSITTAARKGTEALQQYLDELFTLEEVVSRHINLIPKSPSKEKSLVLMVSDIHMGKQIIGIDETIRFNLEICKNRILSLPQLVIDSLIQPIEDFGELVILLMGDIVDGEMIYRGQSDNIETHVAEQVLLATRYIWQIIKDFGSMFPSVRVITTRGNHGRTEGGFESNWDNIIYQQLLLLSLELNDPSITICNKYGNFNILTVQGWKGLIRHEAPNQSDTAAARNKLGGWKDIHQCDFLAYGHWHHIGLGIYNNMPIFRNGCFSGGDDYSERYGGWDGPAQMMFGVTPNRIPSFITPLFLE